MFAKKIGRTENSLTSWIQIKNMNTKLRLVEGILLKMLYLFYLWVSDDESCTGAN